MFQIAFGASCMNRASVFEWHKRFKGDRESVRFNERCGRSKEVRTPELIGQMKSFIDNDRRVSYSKGTEDAEDLLEELRVDQKERRCHDSRETVELINPDPAVLDSLWTCNESWIYCYDTETKRQSSQWKHDASPRPKKARQSKSTHKLSMITFLESTGLIYMHCVPTGQTVNKEYYVEFVW